MNKVDKIPVDKHGWIDYQDWVLIIERDSSGNVGNFQYDGVSCLQGSIQGFVVDAFKSKSKWFNTEWWYCKTCWGEKYPSSIYFSEGLTPIEKSTALAFAPDSEKAWKETFMIADEKARPSEKILEAIMKEVVEKTGRNYKLDFENHDYGKEWYESYIPIKLGGFFFFIDLDEL